MEAGGGKVTRCLIVSGTHSGVGKTSVALGLMAALRNRGLVVQPFKVGPDYLDPLWHRLAAGRTSYNLDTWMSGSDHVQQLFREKSAGADIAVVEGVMGLFDGASPTDLCGSTAEVAAVLEAPVLLVASAHGAGRSFAATVKGFCELEPQCQICAVVANLCGSARHAALLREALVGSRLCSLVGSIPREALPQLPSRHLGLQTPQEKADASSTIASLADAISASVDLDALYDIAGSHSGSSHRYRRRSASPEASPGPAGTTAALETSSSTADTATVSRAPTPSHTSSAVPPHITKRRATLAVAMDEAFQFYYPDDLELLENCGIDIVRFSPLLDKQLPAEMDGAYFGGGYPEEAAAELSQNVTMRESVARFARAGNVIYAECGGMMYLAQAMCDRDGRSWPMVGLLPFATRMLDRRKRLGYVETSLTEESLLGPPGTVLRGHEFHYSEIVEPFPLDGWSRPYQLRNARGSDVRPGGFARENVLASYVHQHFHSNPQAAVSLARALLRARDRRSKALGSLPS